MVPRLMPLTDRKYMLGSAGLMTNGVDCTGDPELVLVLLRFANTPK